MIELFIEGQQADINVGFSTMLNFVIDDIKDFGAKNTSFSKTIILPGTKTNNDLFGNIFNINRSTQHVPGLPNYGYNFNAAVSAKALIFSDNIQVFKGVFRMMEIIIEGDDVESYEVVVFGELGGFISKLSNNRLENLDFSAYDHVYSLANITGSWTNANSGTGYYYPLIDYGGVSTGAFGVAKKDYQFRTFRPALHKKEYMNKVIANAGYTWESAFCDTDFFKRLIIPNNQKALFIPKNKLFQGTPSYTEGGSLSGATYDVAVTSSVAFPSFVGGLFTTPDNKLFTYTGSPGTFSFDLTLFGNTSYVLAGFGSTIYVNFDILKNGTAVYSSPTFIYTNGPALVINSNINVNIFFATSDTFEVRIRNIIHRVAYGVHPLNWATYFTGTSLSIDSAVPILSPAELGDNLKFNEIQPKNIFQKDFFSSILKMYSLLVTEDKTKPKHLIITPYIDFFNATPSTFVNWSDKIDRNRPQRIKPMSELNARYYEFKYKQDSDFFNEDYRKKYNEGYGDRIYDNGYEFAKEKETVEIIFANSVLTGYVGEAKVVPAIFKRNNNVEDKVEHVIRVMQAKRVTGVPAWNIMNGATVLGTYTEYPYAGHLDDPDAPVVDISFGVPKELYFTLATGDLSNNLFNVYYSPYFAEITDVDSKLLSVTARLTRQDINNLDFSKFIWIDGGLFRLNKIEEYNATEEDTCKVELLKTINTIY